MCLGNPVLGTGFQTNNPRIEDECLCGVAFRRSGKYDARGRKMTFMDGH
jgi:hypothetical protein